MIRKEMAMANRRSRAQVETVNGGGVGLPSSQFVLSIFVGSTEGKGNSTSLSFYPKLIKHDSGGSKANLGWIGAHSAGFVEML